MNFKKYIYRKKIKDLPEDLLPREKALKYGISSLSDIELLALSLGQGTKDLNVLGLADLILKNRKLKDLKDLKIEDLTKIKGIGKAKALQILSIGEIIKRVEEDEESIIFEKPSDVFKHIKWLSKEKQEKMLVLYTNTMNQLLGEEIVAVGSLNIVNIKPRDIFIPALRYNAYGIILVHNHPEGSPEPSKEDIKFTGLIKDLSIKMGFELLDHIIVGKKGYFSFSSEGLI
ncbi:MAG TPA: JAB domain-containing protein [Persephonella sp.]|uniref:DNA repair protein RadC n=1 Tax=Persephonella marina (strain DSM 14350 / EX-H1) TaxID=123214 RepID=C0QRE1_PERMH|nr:MULTISPECIES: DNA repair protein RadC [Persephonella]ACO04465.1 DNA repair protein RadC [Persephonella marina EX-H1]HCB68983.1 JAB domain-containing protein [Persephonella sp.]